MLLIRTFIILLVIPTISFSVQNIQETFVEQMLR